MTCFFSVSAISLYSPHCRSPNNIQLYFLALLYNADCCKEHLAKCPSPKPSLWLSDLTHILLTFLSLYLFTQSQLKYQSICHIFFHLKIQNTFKLSQQIRQEFCRRQLHLSKPDPFQRSSAQSKVMVPFRSGPRTLRWAAPTTPAWGVGARIAGRRALRQAAGKRQSERRAALGGDARVGSAAGAEGVPLQM